MTQTIKFAYFPFTHKGYNFVSKVAETSRYLPQIMMIGEVFIEMNKGAVDELLPNLETATMSEILEALDVINFGGTEMFLELAGE
jgi:hypothetical protein